MVETENVLSTEKVSNDVRRMCKVVRATKSLERLLMPRYSQMNM